MAVESATAWIEIYLARREYLRRHAERSFPVRRVGMLKEALLRNVRFVAVLALHTRGMTVEQAQQLFEDKAFIDRGNARQQAVRASSIPCTCRTRSASS